MLKTSPILSSSPGSSSAATSFHHVPARHSQESPGPIVSTSRRTSSRSTSSSVTSMKSPSQTRLRRPAPAPPTLSLQSQEGHQFDQQPPPVVSPFSSRQISATIPTPPPPAAQPESEPTSASRTAIDAQPDATASSGSSLHDGQLRAAVSPNKRRGSPASGMGQAEAGASSTSGASTQSQPTAANATKRPKPDEQPPKTLPQRYEFCAVEDMVELIAHMLAELITTNDAIRMSNGGLTRFHSRTAPGISVRDYLHRLAKHATLTPPLLLSMVYYIDRLCALYQEFTINTLTVHRFLITAATVAAKGLSDSFWNNTTYARVGGVRVAELKLLELEFLYRVDWKIVPNPEILVAYYRGLVERTPGYTLESGESSGEETGEDIDDDADEDEEEETDG